MPAVKTLKDDRQGGFTLVEVMVATGIMLLVLVMVSTTTLMATSTSQNAANEGQSLGPALLAEQQAQKLLESAWTPSSTTTSVTNECTLSESGESFPSSEGQGPFVEATTTEIQFCGIIGSSLTAYTYDMYLTGCNSSASSCSFEIYKWGPPSGGSPKLVFKEAGLSGTAAPFSFWKATSTGAMQQICSGCTPVPATDLSTIGAVQVTLNASATAGDSTSTFLPGTTLQRMVVLFNAGGGDT